MSSADRPGFFVAIDGMAGAGKTTTTEQVHQYLVCRRYSAYTTAEPTTSGAGMLARHQTDLYRGYPLACLVAADRYLHLQLTVLPGLHRGETVICDRYIASSYVLQQIDGVPLPFIESLNSHANLPDLVAMLVVDPAVAAARISARGAHDRFQSGLEASQAEADLYREAASILTARGVRVMTIDTTHRSPHQVTELIGQRITEEHQPPQDRQRTP